VRISAGIAVILIALAGTLGLSISSSLRDQERLIDELTDTTRQQVHGSVNALSARLDALDEDTRVLADIVEGSRGMGLADQKGERRVWEAAFRALAVVVAQYRLITLVDGAGTVQVLAGDPTESQATIDALVPPTLQLAHEVSRKHERALAAPARFGDRSFLLYGRPVRGGGSIIVASDAKIFLGAIAWSPIPIARLFVTDPAGVIWAGCETSQGCAIAPSETVPGSLPRSLPDRVYVTRGSKGGGGFTSTPAVQVSERLARPTGVWSVTWLASTEALAKRQRSLMMRVVLTALAAVVAVAGVGAAMFRQHRNAMLLESRLQVAQALVRAEKLITVGVLSAGMAHEIGSPLAVIRGRAERVLDHPEKATQSEDMRLIIKHTDNISSKIRQLLDFSRKQVVAPSAVPFDLAVERARELVQWKLTAKRLTLVLSGVDGLPPLAADSEQLGQVLVNLLLNACDASNKGQTVLVTATFVSPAEVGFSVIDHGCGIATQDMNTIFDPFFTTKKRGEGTGLGLTIVEGIVRNHGGHIDVASNPGRGTTVTVRWPVATAERLHEGARGEVVVAPN